MDTVLLVITLISAATAIVAVASAWRLRRHDRERSEARVAALASAAETHGARDGGWTAVSGEWQWNPEPSQPQHAPPESGPIASFKPRVPAVEIQPATGAFFGTVERESPSSSRLPIFAAAALLVILGGALVFLNTNTSDSSDSAATVAPVSHTEPLELVALGHARETNALTISGTVRNPSNGAKVEGLTAVISLLDRSGALVSTKDVPLDYRALKPGEEAPFKVSIPDPGSIARYRVSFRAGTDVVPHVDRRVATKLASALQ